MKKAILCTFVILLATTAFAQHETPNCNQNKNSKEVLPVTIFAFGDRFEYFAYSDEYQGLIENDSSLNILKYNILGIDSVWAAGIPEKNVWDSTILRDYSKPRALLTDTANPYPPNNHSVMEINVEKPAWTAMYNYCWSRFELIFDYVCDTDTLKDGMYIEISFDGGQSFVNAMDTAAILNANNGPDDIENFVASQMSMIGDSVLGYTGNIKNNWYEPGGNHPYLKSFELILWWDDIHGYDVTNTIVRIHFVSDSIDNPRQGIMIDDLGVKVEEWCYVIGKEENELNNNKHTLYPNPVIKESWLKFNNKNRHKASLKIYNSTGSIVFTDVTKENQFIISNRQFKPGIYMYRLIVGDTNYTGKFIVK
ncbi:MAG TPA: T9SS type A sorting domain-containing protein [Bacteroidales bacterium]|nr:T9SS type A sorting domain-containing protein [Bacteroidales bacterium]